MSRESLFIVGRRDCVEAGLFEHFSRAGWTVWSSVRENLDVLDRRAVDAFISQHQPSRVIVASVRSGGIAANQKYPAEFFTENILAQTHVIDTAYRHGVGKLLYLAASCVYPRECPQPIREEYFQNGLMEPTSEAYSMAKSAGIAMCQAYRRQYGFNAIAAVPATVYGTGGDEDPARAHVLGSLMARVAAACASGESLTCWGTGTPRREFIHAADLASAAAFLLEHYEDERIINVGVGEDVSVKSLVELIVDVYGFKGLVSWDTSRPDGAPRKWLDSTRLFALGWRPMISLKQGIALCVDR